MIAHQIGPSAEIVLTLASMTLSGSHPARWLPSTRRVPPFFPVIALSITGTLDAAGSESVLDGTFREPSAEKRFRVKDPTGRCFSPRTVGFGVPISEKGHRLQTRDPAFSPPPFTREAGFDSAQLVMQVRHRSKDHNSRG